jgi:adenylate cyclase
LVEATAGSHTLVVVTFRPEFAAGWMRRSWYRQLPLSPLAPAVVAGLLGELLGSDPSLDGLAELIADRTGGNPFYLEEVVRQLAETGVLTGESGDYRLAGEVSQVAIPDTVQAVLAARIDRLGNQAKDVLAAASVIGREFDRELLERIAQTPPGELETVFERLIEAELIAQTEVYPVAVYAFRHPLTHEVALGALLSERRRELHRRAGVAIAELNTERPGEVAALIARHYEHAGLVLEACTWHIGAAIWAMANDQPAAVRHLDQVRALDHDLPDGADADRLRANARALLLSIGWRVGADLRHMRQLYDQSVAAATRAQDHRLLARAQISLAGCVMKAGGRFDEAAELAAQAFRAARLSGDQGLCASVQASASYRYIFVGRIRDALDAAEAVLELTADRPELNAGTMIESPRGYALQSRCLALALLGHTNQAGAIMNEAEEFLRSRGYKETLAWHAYYRVLVLRATGAAMNEAEITHEAYAMADAVGGQHVKTLAQVSLGAAHLALGQSVEAAEASERAIALIEKFNTLREAEPLARQIRALALVATGHPRPGMAEAERAIRCCVEQGNRAFTPWSCAAFAIAAATAATQLDNALEVLDDGEGVVAETGARGLLPELLDARARVRAARGEQEARRETLQRGLQIARENQAQGWEKRFEDALAGGTEPLGGRHE